MVVFSNICTVLRRVNLTHDAPIAAKRPGSFRAVATIRPSGLPRSDHRPFLEDLR